MEFNRDQTNLFALARAAEDPAEVVATVKQIEEAPANILLQNLYSAIENDRVDDARSLLRALQDEYETQTATEDRLVAQAQTVRSSPSTASEPDTSDISFEYIRDVMEIELKRAQFLGQVALYLDSPGSEVPKSEALQLVEELVTNEKEIIEKTRGFQSQVEEESLPPRVVITDVSASRTQLQRGATATVSINVENIGDETVEGVTIDIEGGNTLKTAQSSLTLGDLAPRRPQQNENTASGSAEADLSSMKQQTIELTGNQSGAESVRISVNSANGGTASDSVTMNVEGTDSEDPGIGRFEVTAITDETPTEVAVDEPFDVQYTVENVGDGSDRQAIRLELDGQQVANKPDTLTPGQSVTNSFTDVTLPDGVEASETVEVTVRTNNDVATANLTVTAGDDGDPTPEPSAPPTEYAPIGDSTVNNQGVTNAIADWQAGDLDNSEIVEVIQAWQTN